MQLIRLIIIYSTAYDGQNQWQEGGELACEKTERLPLYDKV